MGKSSKAKREQAKKIYKSELKKLDSLHDTIESEIEKLALIDSIDKNEVMLLAARYDIYKTNRAILDQMKRKYRF